MQLCSLESLPIEILDLVLDNVKKTDFCNIRLTCRTLKHNSFEAFCRRFMRCATFIINNESLRHLTSISKHPEFAARIEAIEFGSANVRSVAGCYNYRSKEKSYEQICKVGKAAWDEANLWRHGTALDTVVEALKRFPKCKKISTVGQIGWWPDVYEEFEPKQRTILGLSALEQSLGMGLEKECRQAVRGVFNSACSDCWTKVRMDEAELNRLVLAAIAESGKELKALDLFSPAHGFVTGSHHTEKLRKALSRIQTFEFVLEGSINCLGRPDIWKAPDKLNPEPRKRTSLRSLAHKVSLKIRRRTEWVWDAYSKEEEPTLIDAFHQLLPSLSCMELKACNRPTLVEEIIVWPQGLRNLKLEQMSFQSWHFIRHLPVSVEKIAIGLLIVPQECRPQLEAKDVPQLQNRKMHFSIETIDLKDLVEGFETPAPGIFEIQSAQHLNHTSNRNPLVSPDPDQRWFFSEIYDGPDLKGFLGEFPLRLRSLDKDMTAGLYLDGKGPTPAIRAILKRTYNYWNPPIPT